MNANPPERGAIGPGRWHVIQWNVHFASDATGYIRFWLDDTYLGQWDGQTISSGDPHIGFIVYGDYWNGSPFEDSDWYMDEVIMTSEPPDTQDADGHPYIAPTTRVSDWE